MASTPSPNPFVRITKAPTDSYIFRSDKRPIKNIITTALTRPLTSVVGKNTTNGNGHGAHGEHDGNGEHEMLTAPSYTFYASERILNGSSFVLNTSRAVLEYLQDWLNVRYPFSKLGKLNRLFIILKSVMIIRCVRLQISLRFHRWIVK